MASKKKKKWCEECQRNVQAVKDERKIGCVAHFLFFAVFVITGLLTIWLSSIIVVPIWMLFAFYDNSKFECPRCGSVCK